MRPEWKRGCPTVVGHPLSFSLRDDLRTGEDARVIRRGRFPNFVGCGYRIPFGPIRQRRVRSMGPVRKGAENSRRRVPRRGAEKTTCGFYAAGGIGGKSLSGWCRKKHDEPNDGLSFGFPCGRKRMLVLRRHPLSCVRNRVAFGAENVCPKHCFPMTRAPAPQIASATTNVLPPTKIMSSAEAMLRAQANASATLGRRSPFSPYASARRESSFSSSARGMDAFVKM